MYADADSVCLKPLDPILNEVTSPFFAALENEQNSSGLIANSVLGSAPENPDLRTLLEHLDPDPHTEAWKGGLKTLYYCRAIKTGRAEGTVAKVEREVFPAVEEQPQVCSVDNPSECESCQG